MSAADGTSRIPTPDPPHPVTAPEARVAKRREQLERMAASVSGACHENVFSQCHRTTGTVGAHDGRRILIAAMLAKLGHGWWSIAVMVALCLLASVRNAEGATPNALPRSAGEPGLGSKSLVVATGKRGNAGSRPVLVFIRFLCGRPSSPLEFLCDQ
jgi:hypothetical protein